MGGKNVKNTMVERVLDMFAPHLCFGCGKIGTCLCDDCKYDIINEPFVGCVLCSAPSSVGLCDAHRYLDHQMENNQNIVPIERAFVVGERTGSLQACIDGLKFSRAKRAAGSLAELLHATLPLELRNAERIHIVPVPTASSHIRERGYDQVLLIARHLGVMRGLSVEKLLTRTSTATQHVLNRLDRQKEAALAYTIAEPEKIRQGDLYIVIDDIITTGSTVSAAAQVLHKAGARVWTAALAYQPNARLQG